MKRIITALILCIFSSSSYGQIMVKSTGQTLVESATSGAFYEISQSYQLLDTLSGKKYGRYEKPEFGKSSAIGIKIKGGFITSYSVLTPWENDGNYDKYRGQQYKPIISSSQIRNIENEETRSISLPSEKQFVRLSNEKYVFVPYDFSDDSSLETGVSTGRQDGWLVLFSKSSEMKVHTIREMCEIPSDRSSVAVNAEIKDDIVGGVYVVPTVKTVGIISMVLYGVLEKDGDIWSIVFPFNESPQDVKQSSEHQSEGLPELSVVTSAEESPVETEPETIKKQHFRKQYR